MSRIRSITSFAPGVRRVPLLVAIAAAVLLAIAVTYQPPGHRGTTDEGGRTGGTSGTSSTVSSDGFAGRGGEVLVDPAVGDADPAVADKVMVEPEARDAAGGASSTTAVTGTVAPTAAESVAADAVGSLGVPELDSKIVRTASIDLRVKRGGSFEDVWSSAQRVARANGGYVVSASRSGAGKGPRGGSITMRIPTAKFDGAVDRLRGISGVQVRQLDVASQDVTQEYVDVRSRLKHDRAVEARLLALLAQTKGVSEVLAVQTRLDQVQEQIELSKGRLDYLDKMTSMSTIELSISERGAKVAEADDEESVFGTAWTDARERFSENVASAIVWVGGALPTLVLVALVAVVGRIAWRRRDARSRGAERVASGE